MARRAMGLLLGLVARLWLASLKLTLIIDPALAAARPRPFALAFWHGQQLALLRWAMSQRMAALVSRSRDGELAATALGVLGIACARGSSSRGGAAGLRGMVRRMREGMDAAFAVDGPRGPARVAKAEGARAAARLAGGVVVPMAAACARAHVLARSWDRFELPLPFTRVVVALGAPMEADEATQETIGEGIERAREMATRAVKKVDDAGETAPVSR
jgi:lysophospholipid acyltransferase (LPLAT)-like uncharacterized protein